MHSRLFQEPAATLQLRQQGGKLSRQGQAWQPNPTLDALKPRPNDLVLLHMPALPDSHQYMPGLSPSSNATITIRSQGGNTYMRTALSVFILRQVCWWWWCLWWWLRIWQGCYSMRALSLLVCNILEDKYIIFSLCWLPRYCLSTAFDLIPCCHLQEISNYSDSNYSSIKRASKYQNCKPWRLRWQYPPLSPACHNICGCQVTRGCQVPGGRCLSSVKSKCNNILLSS